MNTHGAHDLCIYIHAHTNTNTQATNTRSLPHTHSRTRTYTTLAHAHVNTHARTHAHTHARSHTRTHARTQPHTYTPRRCHTCNSSIVDPHCSRSILLTATFCPLVRHCATCTIEVAPVPTSACDGQTKRSVSVKYRVHENISFSLPVNRAFEKTQ